MSDPRPLTEDERALLGAFLERDFDGVEVLRAYAADLLASPSCGCGCGSITLHLPDGAPPLDAPMEALPAAFVAGQDGLETLGEVTLFLRGDSVELDLCSFPDHPPLRVPPVERLY